ncbi:MAG: glycine zipper 2TM domain-containing protein, partial [Gammaproteobacteria bacterium]
DAATAAGALIGAAIGHDHAARHRSGGRYEQVGYERRCRVVDDHRTEEHIAGYDVTYRYHGETFSTRLPYDPGRRLKVRVKVTPERH